MQNDAFSLLQKQLQDEIDSVSQALVSGGAKDYADYTGMCGRVRGLQLAQRVIGEMQARLRGDDED